MKFAIPVLFLVAAAIANAAPATNPGTGTAATSPPPSARSLMLARQLIADTNGFEGIGRQSVQVMMGIGGPHFITSPQLYLKEYQQALDRHRKEVEQGNALIAKIYARLLTPQELSDEIAFFESPIGRSIRRKQDAAAPTMLSGHPVPPILTPEEQAALADFKAKSENSILKKIAIMMQMRAAIDPLLQSISDDAMRNYCKDGGDCSKIHIPAPN